MKNNNTSKPKELRNTSYTWDLEKIKFFARKVFNDERKMKAEEARNQCQYQKTH